MHRTKLTHTDLKPENILFVSSDFGIFYDARKVRKVVIILYSIPLDLLKVCVFIVCVQPL